MLYADKLRGKNYDIQLAIIKTIYKLGAVSAADILVHFFHDRYSTRGSHVLRSLIKKGFIFSRPLFIENQFQRRGAMYSLTSEAITYLFAYGHEPFARRLSRITPGGESFSIVNDINSLYFGLPSWELIVPRDYKVKNPRARVKTRFSAVLRHAAVGDLCLYYIHDKLQRPSLSSILRELSRDLDIFPRVALVSRTHGILKQVESRLSRLKTDDHLNLSSLHLVTLESAHKLLPTFFIPEYYRSFLATQFSGEVESATGTTYADYVVGGKYISEYITRDFKKLYFLKSYTLERSEREGREVVLLAQSSDATFLVREFEAYPHVTVYPIDNDSPLKSEA